ncbi:MAG: hypothetical protein K8T91_24135, partial [Planctomycetes bacterium]|nr:hypothetical protein [Planctomycetota bacterium]
APRIKDLNQGPLPRQVGLLVDDRVHLMQILRHEVPHLFLFGDPSKSRHCPPWARYVSAWPEVVNAIASAASD